MAINKAIGLVSTLAILGGIVACSSTDNGTTTPADGGGSKPDTGTIPPKDSGPGPGDTGSPAAACIAKDSLTGYTDPTALPPPAAWINVCDATKLDAMATACLLQASTAATCAAWKAANGACGTCVLTAQTAATSGPLITDATGEVVALNQSGCLDHQKAGCGGPYEKYSECANFVCDTNPGGNCEGAADADVQACNSSATVCDSRLTAAQTACTGVFTQTGGPGAVCFPSSAADSGLDYLKRFAGLFCGGAVATDAGGG